MTLFTAWLVMATAGKPELIEAQIRATRHCMTQKADVRVVECSYTVGRDLRIAIAGVGLPDASVVFDRSVSAGDAYAKFQLAIGCVLVKHGDEVLERHPEYVLDMAFISPRTGQVYSSPAECGAAR